MPDQFLEEYRQKEVKNLRKMKTFENCWPTWLARMRIATSDFSDAEAIWGLGGQLSDVFRSTGQGRTQSSQSGGGAAWEALVCWYLNVAFAGTTAIAFKQKKTIVPKTIFDAATVKYGNYKTNTESDVCVLVLPSDVKFGNQRKAIDKLDHAVRERLGETHLAIIQCKTNWNDNAQIPMLWDMVYQGNYPEKSNVRIGTAGVTIKKMASFRYSFVVVPTVKADFTSASMAVHRIRGLTGGNYWGQPSKSGVAQSLSEIFTDNFDYAFPGTVQKSINSAISDNLIRPLCGF